MKRMPHRIDWRGTLGFVLGSSAYGAHDRYEDHRPDHACDQVADPAGKRDADDRQQGIGDDGAENAQDDIEPQIGIGSGNCLGNPSSESADDDCPDPAYTFHASLRCVRDTDQLRWRPDVWPTATP